MPTNASRSASAETALTAAGRGVARAGSSTIGASVPSKSTSSADAAGACTTGAQAGCRLTRGPSADALLAEDDVAVGDGVESRGQWIGDRLDRCGRAETAELGDELGRFL